MTSEFALNIVVYFRVFSDPSCREGRPCGSIFQRRENKGPGCLIGCGLNYPRSGLDWPESQLTSARCNFQGTRCHKYLSIWKICSYIFKLAIYRLLFMRIENSKIIPIGYIEVLHSEVMVMEQREKFSKMFYDDLKHRYTIYTYILFSYFNIFTRYVCISRGESVIRNWLFPIGKNYCFGSYI